MKRQNVVPTSARFTGGNMHPSDLHKHIQKRLADVPQDLCRKPKRSYMFEIFIGVVIVIIVLAAKY